MKNSNLHYEYGNIERMHELSSHIEPHTTKHHASLMIVCLTSLISIVMLLTLYNTSVYAGLGEIEKATMLFKQF